MKRVTTEVESLMFESTPVGLARQLCCRGGIQDVEVDARAGTATIDYEDQGLTVDDVLRFIAESGYCVRGRRIESDRTDGMHVLQRRTNALR